MKFNGDILIEDMCFWWNEFCVVAAYQEQINRVSHISGRDFTFVIYLIEMNSNEFLACGEERKNLKTSKVQTHTFGQKLLLKIMKFMHLIKNNILLNAFCKLRIFKSVSVHLCHFLL
jgi:hypothetical protein